MSKPKVPATITDAEMEKIRDRAVRYQVAHGGGSFGDKAARFRRAHRADKAGTN